MTEEYNTYNNTYINGAIYRNIYFIYYVLFILCCNECILVAHKMEHGASNAMVIGSISRECKLKCKMQ